MKENKIIVDSHPRNYYGGFVLIKPSRPFYKVEEDYTINSFPDNQVIAKARLVYKRTYPVAKIPDVASLMYRDMKASALKVILKSNAPEPFYDVLVFSNNAHYQDWYADRKEEAKEMRQKECKQLEAF